MTVGFVFPMIFTAVAERAAHALPRIEFADKVGSPDAFQFLLNVAPLLRFVPEEELPLCQFLALCLGTAHRLQCIRIVACVPCFGTNGHRGRREVLHLLQLEVQPLGDDSQFCHVFLPASWVAADEVGDNLLAQVLFVVDAVEDSFEFLELRERRLAHQLQHTVAGMLRRHLQPSAHMVANQFTRILAGRLVAFLILALIE